MDEARLAEIEAFFDELHAENLRGTVRPGLFALDRARTDAFLITASMLLGEVRRLRTRITQLDQYFLATTRDRLELAAEARRLKEAVEGAYRDGESNGLADITGIISDPADGDNATPEDILSEIKGYLGWEGD